MSREYNLWIENKAYGYLRDLFNKRDDMNNMGDVVRLCLKRIQNEKIDWRMRRVPYTAKYNHIHLYLDTEMETYFEKQVKRLNLSKSDTISLMILSVYAVDNDCHLSMPKKYPEVLDPKKKYMQRTFTFEFYAKQYLDKICTERHIPYAQAIEDCISSCIGVATSCKTDEYLWLKRSVPYSDKVHSQSYILRGEVVYYLMDCSLITGLSANDIANLMVLAVGTTKTYENFLNNIDMTP